MHEATAHDDYESDLPVRDPMTERAINSLFLLGCVVTALCLGGLYV